MYILTRSEWQGPLQKPSFGPDDKPPAFDNRAQNDGDDEVLIWTTRVRSVLCVPASARREIWKTNMCELGCQPTEPTPNVHLSLTRFYRAGKWWWWWCSSGVRRKYNASMVAEHGSGRAGRGKGFLKYYFIIVCKFGGFERWRNIAHTHAIKGENVVAKNASQDRKARMIPHRLMSELRNACDPFIRGIRRIKRTGWRLDALENIGFAF